MTMGILRNMNYRRHTRVLRSLDYENMPASTMREGDGNSSGRLSDSLYEGTNRVPSSGEQGDDVEPTAHLAVQGQRPHPKAQWDDVRGVWVVWDDAAGDWVPVEEEH
jgi:hypothetical protein